MITRSTTGSIIVVAPASAARGALVARLEREGYLVRPARGRAEARDILAAKGAGAVYVDLSLPGREGRLLLQDLDEVPRLRMLTRIVELAAWRRNTRPVSGAAVFVKPVDLEHVIRTLRTVYPPVAPALAS